MRISGSDAGYTMFRGSVKGTGYTLHSPVSPSLPLPCVTVCHHISTGLYLLVDDDDVVDDDHHLYHHHAYSLSSFALIRKFIARMCRHIAIQKGLP